jgi:hypothetical protein
MIGCMAAYVGVMLPLMLSSSMLHYPQRVARVDAYADECGSDWWFGQIPDIFLVSFDLPVVALIFVPYFVVLHAAEGVRLAIQAYAAEFEMRLTPLHRDENTVAETVRALPRRATRVTRGGRHWRGNASPPVASYRVDASPSGCAVGR